MNLSFEVEYSQEFARQFEHFPTEQQDKILDFIEIFEQYGLSDFSKYQGKITPSWNNLPETDDNYRYTKRHNLWHYHMGDPKPPEYRMSVSGRYKTSDRLLHFIRASDNKIVLVDVLDHYRDRERTKFWLPDVTQL